MSSVLTQASTWSVLSKHDRGPERLSGLPWCSALSEPTSSSHTLAPFLRRTLLGYCKLAKSSTGLEAPGVIHTASESY